jgi:tRNA A37 threonylcarbamoyladenosine biosynthesis protein TsaE
MEWPELIEDLLPPGTIRVKISVGEHGERLLKIE